MDLGEVGWEGVDWINLAQDRDRWRALMYTVMNLRVSWNAGNFLSSLGHFGFSGRILLHGVSYHLCILLVFISNYTTVHGVERTKLSITLLVDRWTLFVQRELSHARVCCHAISATVVKRSRQTSPISTIVFITLFSVSPDLTRW
jgi:hypothetical protein